MDSEFSPRDSIYEHRDRKIKRPLEVDQNYLKSLRALFLCLISSVIYLTMFSFSQFSLPRATSGVLRDSVSRRFQPAGAIVFQGDTRVSDFEKIAPRASNEFLDGRRKREVI